MGAVWGQKAAPAAGQGPGGEPPAPLLVPRNLCLLLVLGGRKMPEGNQEVAQGSAWKEGAKAARDILLCSLQETRGFQKQPWRCALRYPSQLRCAAPRRSVWASWVWKKPGAVARLSGGHPELPAVPSLPPQTLGWSQEAKKAEEVRHHHEFMDFSEVVRSWEM